MLRAAPILAALPLALLSPAVAAQGAFDIAAPPEAAAPPPAGAAPEPAGPEWVRLGEPAVEEAARPEAVTEALVALHRFYRDQIEVARLVQFESNQGVVADLASAIVDDFKRLDLELARLATPFGGITDRPGPLGATELARDFAHEERMIRIEQATGATLDATFLAPLPDDLRYGLGLVNAAKVSGTLEPELLRYLNAAAVQMQTFLTRAQDLIVPRLRVGAGRSSRAG